MCGLYGYSTHRKANLNQSEKKLRSQILTGLALAMQERGTHSTGIAGICNTPHSLKQAVSASEFVQTPEFKKFTDEDHRMVVGHTRLASSGAVSNENAHPFTYGNITGAHNGSVSNYRDVFKDADVDSQAIFYNLDKYNNDFEKAFAEIRGRFAITWFDHRNKNKLYFVTSGNPLVFVLIPEIRTHFWCSLKYPLQAVIGSHFSMKKKNFWEPAEDYVYELSAAQEIKKTKIAFKSYYTNYANTSYADNHKSDPDYNIPKIETNPPLIGAGTTLTESQRRSAISAELAAIIGKDKKTTYYNHDKPGYSSTEWDKENWRKIYNLTDEKMGLMLAAMDDGCIFCNNPIDLDVEGGMFWHEREESIVCIKCADEFQDFDSMTFLDIYDVEQMEVELIEKSREEEYMDDYSRYLSE